MDDSTQPRERRAVSPRTPNTSPSSPCSPTSTFSALPCKPQSVILSIWYPLSFKDTYRSSGVDRTGFRATEASPVPVASFRMGPSVTEELGSSRLDFVPGRVLCPYPCQMSSGEPNSGWDAPVDWAPGNDRPRIVYDSLYTFTFMYSSRNDTSFHVRCHAGEPDVWCVEGRPWVAAPRESGEGKSRQP